MPFLREGEDEHSGDGHDEGAEDHGAAADVVGEPAGREQGREEAGDVDGEHEREHHGRQRPLLLVHGVERRGRGAGCDEDEQRERVDEEAGGGLAAGGGRGCGSGPRACRSRWSRSAGGRSSGT